MYSISWVIRTGEGRQNKRDAECSCIKGLKGQQEELMIGQQTILPAAALSLSCNGTVEAKLVDKSSIGKGKTNPIAAFSPLGIFGYA